MKSGDLKKKRTFSLIKCVLQTFTRVSALRAGKDGCVVEALLFEKHLKMFKTTHAKH